MQKLHYLRNLLFLIFCCAVLLTLNKTTYAVTAQEIAKKAFKSTVLIVMEDNRGQPMSLGSGFFVRNGEIVSNLHVVKGASRGYVKIVGQKSKYNIDGITGIDQERDLVILKISAGNKPPLTIGNSDKVEVGESVFAVGNPEGLEGTFSQGIVSSVREVGYDKLLQITAPISPGSSGGPVLNSNGEVIGVSVATYREGQNLNFAIPSNYIKSLLLTANRITPLASLSYSNAKNSILSDMGGQSSEGVVGTQFAWDVFGGNYSFSLRNQLRYNVKDVSYLIIFYDSQGNPIDVYMPREMTIKPKIPAGLATRVTGYVDNSVRKLSATVQVRILDFKIVN